MINPMTPALHKAARNPPECDPTKEDCGCDGGEVTGVVSVAGTTRYALDKASRRTRIDSPVGTFGLGYCAWNGNVSAVTNGNGMVTAYAYDVMDRVTNIAWTAADGTPLGGVAYTYNAAGCVTRIERDGRPTLDLAWNGQYQLVSVSTNGVFAEGYAYDALGRRVSTTTQEGTVRHVYGDSWQCLADVDESGNVICSYVWGEGIDNLLAVKIGGNVYYPLTDIQGMVWGYADSQNNVVARWTYDAWGNVLSETCTVPALAFVRYRFQGREWSAATGLINFRMRWYDAATGRWLSKDPIGLSGGLNLYVFCCSDSINSMDAFGCHGSRDGRSIGEKFMDGYYVGTGFGEYALNYYCSVIDDPQSAWYEKFGAYVGGALSALWTRETYKKTAGILISGRSLRHIAHIDVACGDKPKIQFRDQKGNPIFRVEEHPFGRGTQRDRSRWHYHRPPDMENHRPYQGGW